MMKKRWTKMLCVALVMMMLVLTAQPAQAANKYTYSIKTAESGKTVNETNKETYNETTDSYTYKVNIYKITAPESGYITVTVYDYMSDGYENETDMQLYRTLSAAKAWDKDTQDYFLNAYSGQTDMKTVRVPLAKGKTVYLRARAADGYKFKYTFTKAAIPTSNLCRAKATTLKAGVKKTICVPDGYQGYRWYKIKVTTKKTISITFKNLAGYMDKEYPDLTLYDSSRKEIGVVHASGDIYKSVKKLPVGTYYIKVRSDSDYEDSFHQTYLYTLSWK